MRFDQLISLAERKQNSQVDGTLVCSLWFYGLIHFICGKRSFLAALPANADSVSNIKTLALTGLAYKMPPPPITF